jgi:hypothetical protein
MVGFDNAAGIFPIHRGVRFLLLSTSPGTSTRRVRCYFGHRDPAVLDALAGGCLASDDRDDEGVSLSPAFLRRTSGTRSAFPYLRSAQDQRLLERLCHEHPVLTDPGTWALAFGRELNATDDRHLMRETGPGMPVLEGKDIEPFVVHQATAARRVPDGSRLPPDVRKAVTWWRLAYRDVAASTNRLTLIAALVPPGVVTVHSLFCLKTVLPVRRQAYLCAMLNSFVANYLVRLWVTTHLGASLVGQLPVPMPEADSDGFNRLADIALAIAKGQCCSEGTHVEAQTAAARLYGLNEGEYARVLETFPLVDSSLRQRCLDGLGTAG